jgi:hypothetical protein
MDVLFKINEDLKNNIVYELDYKLKNIIFTLKFNLHTKMKNIYI